VVEDKFKCRVCGLSQYPDLPWGEDGQEPSYFICACCGVEFGDEDHDLENCLVIRRNWIETKRCTWFSPKERPVDWDMPAQIRSIPAACKGDDDEALIRIYLEMREQPLTGLHALEKSGR